MGLTLPLFGFLFESYDTFCQLVVSSTGSSTFTTTVCCLRLCAFGFVPSGLLPIVSLPMLVVMSRMGDIGFGVFGLMDPCLYSTELEQIL